MTEITTNDRVRGLKSVLFVARASGGLKCYQDTRLEKTLRQTKQQYVAMYGDIYGEPHYLKFIRSSNSPYRARGQLETALEEFFNSTSPPTLQNVAIVINGYDGLTTNREAFVDLLQVYIIAKNIALRVYFVDGALILGRIVRWLEIDPALIIRMIASDNPDLGGDAERHFLDKMKKIETK
ncbi:hypothetical protein BJX62DRAFT_234991, partial [Aspergillus germanicus]